MPLLRGARPAKNHDMDLHSPDGLNSHPARDDPASLTRLRALSLVEATTLLTLLLVAMPLKHLLGYPMAVSVVGPLHGLAFLAFAWITVQAASAGDISVGTACKLVLSACLPFGGIYSWWTLR